MIHKFLHSLFGLIINIEVMIVVLFILSLLFFYLPKKLFSERFQKWGRRILTFTVMLLLLLISPFPNWSFKKLENYYLPTPQGHGFTSAAMEKEIELAEGFIMLGGSFERRVMASRPDHFAFNQAAGRFIESVELIKRYPHKKVLFTGKGIEISGVKSEAQIAKELFHVFGIDSSAPNFLYEDQSKNTLENAVFSYKMVQPRPDQKWVLVTSAFHMPRSVGLFRKLGWNIIPYPVDFHTQEGEVKWQPSLTLGLMAWRVSMGEWFSMLNNAWFGHSDCVLPHNCSMVKDN